MKPPKKAPKSDIASQEIIDHCELLIREAGGLPFAKLADGKKLSPVGAQALIEGLRGRGLEYLEGKKKFRVPLEEQISARLAGKEFLTLDKKDKFYKQVHANDKSEFDIVVRNLCESGRARVVIRTKATVLVHARENVLTEREVDVCCKLGAALVAMNKLLGKPTYGPATVLREDLRMLAEPLTEILHTPQAPAAPPHPGSETTDRGQPLPRQDLARELREAIAAKEDATIGLVFVPDVIRALLARHALADIHAAIFAESAAGRIELRPEGRAELLQKEDVAISPPGPQQTILTWIRRIATCSV